jgi:hypothetical protein
MITTEAPRKPRGTEKKEPQGLGRKPRWETTMRRDPTRGPDVPRRVHAAMFVLLLASRSDDLGVFFSVCLIDLGASVVIPSS